MGMFDYVSVADKLPVSDEMVKLGLDKNTFTFQTKDLNKCMTTYFIQGRRLLEQRYKTTRWVDDPDSFAGGRIEREDEYLHDMEYHGMINFYHMETVGNLDCWMEYDAKFNDGNLSELKLVKFYTTDNTEKKARLQELFESSQRYHNRWYNKYIFHTKPWGKVRKKLAAVLLWMQNVLQDLRLNLP